MDPTLSSQYVTALLMAAPLARAPVNLTLTRELVSRPYVEMTLTLMERFGVRAEHQELREFRVAPQAYVSPGLLHVEGDASSASYFLAAGAIAGGPVRVHGVGRESLQGDARFAELLEAMGASVSWGPDWIEVRQGRQLQGLDRDLNELPDAAMTLATTALFAQGPTTIRNVANWRVKESDRLAAMACELRKVGATVEEGEDSLTIQPPEVWQRAEIGTYNDHRIAMCFALASLGPQPVTILDPGCTSKTYPRFFKDWSSLVR
jgi:3-phosphoshikimate 1-carboxyvinyltransferase